MGAWDLAGSTAYHGVGTAGGVGGLVRVADGTGDWARAGERRGAWEGCGTLEWGHRLPCRVAARRDEATSGRSVDRSAAGVAAGVLKSA